MNDAKTPSLNNLKCKINLKGLLYTEYCENWGDQNY